MGWFKRKQDPISERSKELNRQIQQLESQIRNLHTAKDTSATSPSTSRSQSSSARASASETQNPSASTTPPRRDPVFESVSQERLQDLNTPTVHLNEQGVQKLDLPALWRRFVEQFSGPTSRNPKLVDLLAAGSLQGMRPLRYEKRIARRRFLVGLVALLLLLWGLFAVLVRG